MSQEDDNLPGEGRGSNPPSTRTVPTPNSRGWISLRQLATVMEVTYHSILRWAFEERFKYIEVGGQKRVYEDEVRYLLEHGTRPPNPAKVGKFGRRKEEEPG